MLGQFLLVGGKVPQTIVLIQFQHADHLILGVHGDEEQRPWSARGALGRHRKWAAFDVRNHQQGSVVKAGYGAGLGAGRRRRKRNGNRFQPLVGAGIQGFGDAIVDVKTNAGDAKNPRQRFRQPLQDALGRRSAQNFLAHLVGLAEQFPLEGQAALAAPQEESHEQHQAERGRQRTWGWESIRFLGYHTAKIVDQQLKVVIVGRPRAVLVSHARYSDVFAPKLIQPGGQSRGAGNEYLVGIGCLGHQVTTIGGVTGIDHLAFRTDQAAQILKAQKGLERHLFGSRRLGFSQQSQLLGADYDSAVQRRYRTGYLDAVAGPERVRVEIVSVQLQNGAGLVIFNA